MYAFCADPHIWNHRSFGGPVSAGLNDRCRIAVETLRKVRAVADEYDARLVVLGDLFHDTDPSPQMIAAVQEPLRDSIIIVGNHDRHSDAFGDHALGPFSPCSHVVESPEVVWSCGFNPADALLCLPYLPGRADEYFEEEVSRLAEQAKEAVTKVLCFHLGVQDGRTEEYLKGAADAIDAERVQAVLERFDIAAAFCGNWHQRRAWNRIVQCGTVCPGGWGDAGLEGYGTVVMFDTESERITLREVPGPRFVDLEAVDDGEIHEAIDDGCSVFVRTADADAVEDWRGLVSGAKYRPDPKADAKTAKDAAKAATAADTLDAALRGWIGAKKWEGVDNGDVLSISRRLLGSDNAD